MAVNGVNCSKGDGIEIMEVQIQQEICPPPDSLTFADVDSKLLRWIEAEQAIVKVVNGWECHKDDVQKQRKGRRYLLEKHEAGSRPQLIDQIMSLGSLSPNSVWDMSKAIELATIGYVAGYLTLREALNVSVTAGKRIQKCTSSWKNMGMAYLRYLKTFEGNSERLRASEAAFEQLRNSSDSPYKAVPFEMELKKTW